jgi:hypothetical protein
MKSSRRARVRFVVLAVVVLLVAMTGSATAARLITGRQIKDGSVTGRDVHNGSLTGGDVRNGSLSADEFEGSLTGAPGPAGPQGPAGPAGPAGANGVSGYEYVIADVIIPRLGSAHQDAVCPVGKRAVGGGMSSSSPVVVRLLESAPLNSGLGWTAGMANSSGSAVTGYVWAVCVVAP